MTTPEAKVKADTAKILDKQGDRLLRVPIVMNSMMRRGTADTLICYNGKFIAMEFKATSSDYLTHYQITFLKDTWLAGGLPMVVHRANLNRLARFLFPGDSIFSYLSFCYTEWLREQKEKFMGPPDLAKLVPSVVTKIFAGWSSIWENCHVSLSSES
jgi:hypothetical protein